MYVRTDGFRAFDPEAQRAAVERLLDLADHLSASDRAVVRGVYDRGMEPTEFARALRQRPRSIRRRVERLVQHVSSPSFVSVLGKMRSWPRQRRRIAELLFLHGCSQRETAERIGVSLHRVRLESDRIRLLIEQET